ncbi:MAG: ribonuclease III, partial [Thermoflexales bacterium]|nr:ribonuclease III [Thermoflexales bacterium]
MLPEFKDLRLLTRALTHASWANEHDPELAPESAGSGPGDNERLEFLGDAVLDFVAGAWLFQRFPEFEEGRLTRVRAALVRATSLARFADAAGLPGKLRLGKGEAESGRTRTNILADAFEALLGALYLDQGTDAVRLFLEPLLEAAMPAILSENLDRDFKTRLQEWSQAYFSVTPRYKLVST